MKYLKNKRILEFGIILIVLLITHFASQKFQLHITYNNGRSFDGLFYYQVAEQFSNGHKAYSEAPFVYRIGTPFMVSVLFRANMLEGFKTFNMIANLFSTILLAVWLGLFLKDWRVRVLMVVLFITVWHGPVRFTYYDPVFSDPWIFVFLLIGLIGIQQAKQRRGYVMVGLLALVSFVGVIFREIGLIIPIAMAFMTNPLPQIGEMLDTLTSVRILQMIKKVYYPFLIPLAAGLAAVFLVRSVAFQSNEYSFLKTAIDWVYDKQFATYLHAYYITYGVLIIIPIYFWRNSIKILWENQYLLVYLAAFLVFGLIGGSDTERFLFWGMPVIFILMGSAIEENMPVFKSPLLILFLGAATVCSQRLFWTISDFPNNFHTPTPILSILSNEYQYLDTWSWFAQRNIQVQSLAEYLVVSVVLLLWLNRRAYVLKPKPLANSVD